MCTVVKAYSGIHFVSQCGVCFTTDLITSTVIASMLHAGVNSHRGLPQEFPRIFTTKKQCRGVLILFHNQVDAPSALTLLYSIVDTLCL